MPAPTIDPRGTFTPTPTGTRTPTRTPTPTVTATARPTPRPPPTATATATATNTPTPTFTPIPPNATARAGPDRDVERGGLVTLNGSGSSDPENERLVYSWTQIYGPDVTSGVGVIGVGVIKGPTPAFTAPDSVSTLILELQVNDGHGDSPPDRIQINVMEHTDTAFFVDGHNGSDDNGDGSRTNPFASMSHAINRIQGPNYDIYVMSRDDGESYTETNTLNPQTSISMYGGFDSDWVRDVDDNRTRIQGDTVAVRMGTVNEVAWFSGFDLTAANASQPGESSFGLLAVAGEATLYIEDNTITAGGAGSGAPGISAGSSYGVFIGEVDRVVVRRNTITAGNGGAADTGPKGGDGAAATTNGGNGSGFSGGGGGKGGVSTSNGGKGGNGGRGLLPQDGSPGGGVGGGVGDKVGEGRVGDGGGGAGGAGGNGGASGGGPGELNQVGYFDPLKSNGGVGSNAGNGVGGGGGGGGAGGFGLEGGAGGGGGGGGKGGVGGKGGGGGGSSIGLNIYNVNANVTIEDNAITAGSGGRGGSGGAGGTGGKGTAGGVGAPNVCSFLGCAAGRSGDGGEGGGGGGGGIGGQGGGGGGGPSYGILFSRPDLPAIVRDNTVTAGNGGNGGIGGAAGLGGSPGGSGGSTGGSGGCCSFLLETAGSPGTGGQGGWSFAVFVYDYDPTNDSVTVSNNTLTAGTPGQGSAINGAPGESGETNER